MKKCSCECCFTAFLWTCFVIIVLGFITFLAALVWLQTPPAHRMAASLIFDAESFNDPDHDTMHWKEISGFFPFNFRVYDVRWLRAQGQCTDKMNVTLVGGEKRCVTVFVPEIRTRLNPWKIFTEQRMVVNDLEIPVMLVNGDALTKPTESKHETHRHETFHTLTTQPTKTTQPTPPWFTLHATTKLDHYDIARLRIVDSSVIASQMDAIHKVRRTIPFLPDPEELSFNDLTFYGKSTVIGQGGSWEIDAHVRFLQPDQQQQHIDAKVSGNHLTQTVELHATFQTPKGLFSFLPNATDNLDVQGQINAKSTWRALNMLTEPFETLGLGLDGSPPFSLQTNIQSSQTTSDLDFHIDPNRQVTINKLQVNHPKGNVHLKGHLGSADAYHNWPERISLQVTNTSTPIETLDADCTKMDCVIHTVSKGGAYDLSVSVQALERGIKVSSLNPQDWIISSRPNPLQEMSQETSLVLHPSDTPEGPNSHFYHLAQQYPLFLEKDFWSLKLENNYGTATLIVNTTSQRLVNLTADIQIEHFGHSELSLDSLKVKAQDETVLLSAENIVYESNSIDLLRLSANIEDLYHTHWNLLIQDIKTQGIQPLVVLARGKASLENLLVNITSDFGYVSNDLAHIEWQNKGFLLYHNVHSGETKVQTNARFGRQTQSTGHFLLEADATLQSVSSISLADFSHYSVDIADDIHTVFGIIPNWITKYVPPETNITGDTRIKAWGDNGELPQAVITLSKAMISVPNHATISETNARLTVPDGEYHISGNYHSEKAKAEFESLGWFAWRRGAARFSSDSYYISDTGTETEFSGELVWKPDALSMFHL